MTLFLYKIGTDTPLLAIEHAVVYTADSVTAEDGTVYGPFGADCELSETEDCAGTLRSDWREKHPDPGEDRDAMLVDLEYRTVLLELGVN